MQYSSSRSDLFIIVIMIILVTFYNFLSCFLLVLSVSHFDSNWGQTVKWNYIFLYICLDHDKIQPHSKYMWFYTDVHKWDHIVHGVKIAAVYSCNNQPTWCEYNELRLRRTFVRRNGLRYCENNSVGARGGRRSQHVTSVQHTKQTSHHILSKCCWAGN